MSWLTENPQWIVLAGLVISAVFYLMARFGSRKILFKRLTTAALAITLTVVVFEQLYVTDREQLERTIYSMVDGARSNDSKKVILHISDSRPDVIHRVSNEMSHLKFDECKVVNIENIRIEKARYKQATIDFTLFVNIDAREKYMCRTKGTRRVRFHFEKEKDARWRLVNGNNLPLQGISAPVTQFIPMSGSRADDNTPSSFQFNPPSFQLEIGF